MLKPLLDISFLYTSLTSNAPYDYCVTFILHVPLQAPDSHFRRGAGLFRNLVHFLNEASRIPRELAGSWESPYSRLSRVPKNPQESPVICEVSSLSITYLHRFYFPAAVKDETTQPNKACVAAAEAFHKDSEYVGIVGAYSSECSVAVQKELKNLSKILALHI